MAHAFIAWETWQKLSADARRDLECYWWNARRNTDGVHFEIAGYRVDEIMANYANTLKDESK